MPLIIEKLFLTLLMFLFLANLDESFHIYDSNKDGIIIITIYAFIRVLES